MIRSFLVMIFFSISILTTESEAQAINGESLLNYCSTSETEDEYPVHAGVCLGYISGIIDHEYLRSNNVAANGIFCIREELWDDEVIGIVRRFIRNNPDRNKELASILVSEALAEAFPCRRAG